MYKHFSETDKLTFVCVHRVTDIKERACRGFASLPVQQHRNVAKDSSPTETDLKTLIYCTIHRYLPGEYKLYQHCVKYVTDIHLYVKVPHCSFNVSYK